MRKTIGNKRINIPELLEAQKDVNQCHIEIGVVRAFDGEDKHYVIDETNNKKTDVYIDVEMVPCGEQLSARLGTLGDSGGFGIIKIPSPGTEVLVAFPAGRFDGTPYIIPLGNTINSGVGVPDELDADTLVISNGKSIVIMNGEDDITINSKQGNVIINANNTVQLNGSTYALPQWDGFAAVLVAFLGTLSSATTVANVVAAGNTLNSAMSSNNNFKSTKVSNG